MELFNHMLYGHFFALPRVIDYKMYKQVKKPWGCVSVHGIPMPHDIQNEWIFANKQ